MVVAAGFLVLAILASVWAVRRRQPLGAGLGLVLLGLCVAISYEAAATWVNARWLPTISQITNRAYQTYRAPWGLIFYALVLGLGLLTVHCTRLAKKPADGDEDAEAEWSLLGTAVLVLANGALISFWFAWLP